MNTAIDPCGLALPEALGAVGDAQLARLRQAGGSGGGAPAEACLRYVLACSEFVAGSALRDPELLPGLVADGLLERARRPGELEAAVQLLVARHDDEPAFMQALRQLRRRELVRIAWRDLTGVARLPETLGELSGLADAAILGARAFAVRALADRFGLPRSPEGEELELVVLGMGKLGGRELNFSSDIDLVFLFPEGGETDGRRSVANEEYFTRLGQAVIRLLDAPTVDGFVFRVDMRLRPFGESGPLVASFGAFEDYLQQHGRDWERYAYVKARAITGEQRYAGLYEDVVRPFVFRRYLDFGVFESLREMKEMIAREVVRREMQDNVKLGPGGIREIEFVVQALQLIRGGSERRLQSPSLLAVLPQLAGAKLLSSSAVRELGESYDFLRRAENRLQMVEDAQTHLLPADDLGRQRLAAAMALEGWEAFSAALAQVRERVAAHFRDVVFGPEGARDEAGLAPLWALEADEQRVLEAVDAFGVEDPAAITAQLLELRGSSYYARIDEHGRKRLITLLPRVLQALVAAERQPGPSVLAGGAGGGALQVSALRRIRSVIESIGGRTAYLALLNENPAALQRLVEICRHGDFLARQVAGFPILLDELIDARVFEDLPDREQFARELDARLAHAAGDLERQIDALRHFRRAARFRVALLDLTGRLGLMRVSDRLTDVAELILQRAMTMAWEQVVAVHGEPRCGPREDQMRTAGLAAIGYGKLGGWELGYASDLDLVFLHDSEGEVQQTTGPKVVENAVFFTRFGQRIVHLLTVHTSAGRLYEVDMRLRPSGKGGLTVTHVRAFEDYQKTEAWTWEHQALLHSRSVAGNQAIRDDFERIRREILMHHIRRDSLRDEVRAMRERMRAELGRSGEGEFDLKQDPGGIADIEFLAQYWVLRWAGEHPPLCTYSDTIRQLESVGSAALVDHAVIDVLVDAYRAYRQVAHRLSLEEHAPVTEGSPYAGLRQAVIRIWEQVMVAGAEPAPL